MNINKLKGKIVEKEKSPDELASAMGISVATYYRKMSDAEKITIGEAKILKAELEMTDAEATEIFLM